MERASTLGLETENNGIDQSLTLVDSDRFESRIWWRLPGKRGLQYHVMMFLAIKHQN